MSEPSTDKRFLAPKGYSREKHLKRLNHAIGLLRSPGGRDAVRKLGPELIDTGYSVFWGSEDDENNFVEFYNGHSYSIKITDLVI